MKLQQAMPYSVVKTKGNFRRQKTQENILKIQSLQKKRTKFQFSLKLEAFSKFKDTKEALKATNSLLEGSMPKKLKKFLNKNIISKEVQDNLAIMDKKLAKQITE